MKTALVLVLSNLKHDARVTRQVNWLKKNFATTVVCFDAGVSEGVEFIHIKQTRLNLPRKAALGVALVLRQFALAYKLFHNYGYLVKDLGQKRFDLIVANDIDTLPLAFDISNGSKVVFDAHEYAPRHFENRRIWRWFFQPFYADLCKRYIPRTDVMLTVGEGLAREYAVNFGKTPVIITNATTHANINPTPVDDKKIRLIHHGIANQSRRLELMLEMMSFLDDRFTLDMILMTSDFASPATRKYIAGLKEKVRENPRISILPGVASSEVVQTINDYDMGVFLIPPVNFNYANTLPNKLFDFIQARLGIAIGPTPEMAAIVGRFNLGVVADDFQPESLAKKLNVLTAEQIRAFKQNAAEAAVELNAEKNEIIFNATINSLVK